MEKTLCFAKENGLPVCTDYCCTKTRNQATGEHTCFSSFTFRMSIEEPDRSSKSMLNIQAHKIEMKKGIYTSASIQNVNYLTHKMFHLPLALIFINISHHHVIMVHNRKEREKNKSEININSTPANKSYSKVTTVFFTYLFM